MNRWAATSENVIGSGFLTRARRLMMSKSVLWAKVLLVAGVVLLSFALPLRLGIGRLQLLLLLILAAGAFPIILRWPELGIGGLIFVSLLVPSPAMPGRLNLSVLLLALLIGLWLLSMLANHREMRLLHSRTIKPLLLFVLVSCLALVMGQLPWFVLSHSAPLDAQLGGLAIFVLSVGAFLLMAHQIRDLRWLERLTWFFLLMGAIFVAGWLLPGLRGFTSSLFLQDTLYNSMFWVWLVALAFGQAVHNRKLQPGLRVALASLVVATLYVAYIRNSGWKSGYIPPLAAIAAIIGMRSGRARLLVSFGGIVLLPFLLPQLVASDLYSYSTRIEAWRLMLEMIKVSPLLGFGPANHFWYARLFPIRGYYVRFNSHSNYVDIAAQTGLLGLACFLWFAWRLGRLGWRLRTRAEEGFAQAYVYGATGGLAGMLVAMILADWVLPFAYNIGLKGFRASMLAWLFLGGLVSIEQFTRGKKSVQ